MNAATFELDWSAPPGCPSRDDVVHATEASLGQSHSDAPPELFVRGKVVRARGGGFVVSLALEDASGRAVGEREVRVEEQSCSAVEEPASLVLALMIAVARPPVEEHRNSPEQAEPPAASAPTPPSVATIVPAQSAALSPSPPPSAEPPPRRVALGVAAVASLGVLPNVGLGFALRATYAPRPIVLLALEASFEDGGSVPVREGGIGFQLYSGSARVGVPALRTARFELIPMAGARGGLIRTAQSGFNVSRNEIRTTVLAGAGVLARFKLTPTLYAEALPEVEGVLLRDRFQVRDQDNLYRFHRPSPFGGRLSLGLGYEFH